MSQPIDCSIFTVEPEDAIHEGCPVITKRRHVVMDKGQHGFIQWPMRFRNGNLADLSECFPSESDSASESESENGLSIVVRFKGACEDGEVLGQVAGSIVDAARGLIRFRPPGAVYNRAGIYRFQAGIVSNGALVFSDHGLVSVEQGMWGSAQQTAGPPTIQEIRMHLRDSQIENDLLMDFEFDDAEIVFAISRPIGEWNETPPPIHFHTCQSFPYKYHWLNAIVGELLRTAAHHYVRNKMNANAGGLTEDDKDKDKDYLAIADFYISEWKKFVATKKVQLNVARAWASQGSGYDG